jgi:hypothetical protein
VLTDVLGYDGARIDALAAAGVLVAERPSAPDLAGGQEKATGS